MPISVCVQVLSKYVKVFSCYCNLCKYLKNIIYVCNWGALKTRRNVDFLTDSFVREVSRHLQGQQRTLRLTGNVFFGRILEQ